MSFYKDLFKYLTALRLPRSRAELNAIIDERAGGGGPGGGGTSTGVVAFLTADSVTLPADPSGNVISYVNATTRMTVLLGANDDTVNWVITRVNGVGVSSTLAGSVLTVSALTSETSYVDITASRTGYTSLTKRFTLTKSRQGAQGNPGEPGGDVTPDPTAPPTPSDLHAFAGISQFTVNWDAAAYTVGHGPGATLIYAIPQAISNPTLPVFDSGALVASVPDPLTSVTIPSNPSTRWFIWAKFQSRDGYLSDIPAGGVNGFQVVTGQDVSLLLTSLNNSITQSQLYSDLSTRINLIDAPAATVGSVNSRILTETNARTSAINTEVVNRNAAILSASTTLSTDYVNRDADVLTNAQNWATSYINSYTYSSAGVDSAISSQINTLVAAIGNSGGNLLPNSNFAVDTNSDGAANGWAVYSTGNTATISLSAGRSGGQAQRVSWTGTNTGRKGVTTNSTIVENGITGGLKGDWQPNRNYVVSWYSRSSTGSAGFPMALYPTVAFTSSNAVSNPNLSSTAWQRYAFQVSTGSSVPGNGEVIASILDSAAATGYIEFADMQVQEGTVLSGYSPSDIATLTAALQTETSARVQGDAANATALTTIQSTTSMFAPLQTWDFTGSVEGWAIYPGGFGTIATGATALTVTANSSAELILVRDLSASEVVTGSLYDKVRMRIRRTAGSGWTGVLQYGISSGHGDSGLFQKIAPEPNWGADPNGWAVVEWDMASLTAGGTDWVSNTVNRLRFDIVRNGAGAAFTAFQIDWIAVGARSAGVSSSVVQQEISTRASQTGGLLAQWTVKTDLNGYVSGFGLASTSNGAAPTSSFIVRANSFSVASPDGPGISPIIPFVVQTTPTTIGSVSVPVGVYMDGAYIKNATITNAKIADASIDNLKVSGIDATKITTGQLVAGQIDTRNLSIRDGAGNIILSAGNPLSISNIANNQRLQNNLIDPSWWVAGVDPSIYWTNNSDVAGENSIVWGTGPKGNAQALFRCVAAGTPSAGPDGGWNPNNIATSPTNAFVVDTTKTYRFVVPIQRTVGTGSAYWGVGTVGGNVCDLNTSTQNGNAYFATSGGLTLNRWYLFVGYVFPAGATGLTNTGSGIYDLTTGTLVSGGSNYNWHPATTQASTRAYQYYGSTGATQFMAPPMVHVVDGSEPSLNEYFQSTAILNNSISINANGTLNGAGTGQVTINGLGYTGDLNATSDISLVASSEITLTGNSAVKSTGNGEWTAQVYSRDSFVGGAYASATVGSVASMMIGLNTDPTSNASYASLDHAIYADSAGLLIVYENGVGFSTGVSYVIGDVLAVVYNGSVVRYLKNGVSIRTPTAVADGIQFFLDSSFATTGARFNNIKFGPMSSTAWGSLTGQPAGIYNTNIYVDSAGNMQGAGTVTNVANNQTAAGVTSIALPSGGSIRSNTGAQGGSLKIRLPQGYNNSMLRFQVEVYEYNSSASAIYEVGGHNAENGGNPGWFNTFARYIGNPNFTRPVRFGFDGTRCAIWIGDPSTIWAYPQVRIRNLLVGYSNIEEPLWSTGWVLSFDGVGATNVTSTVLNPVPGGAMSGIDQITPGNASTYIANAAIGHAQIGSVNAGTITVGTMNADRITAGTITTERIQVGAVGSSVSARLSSGLSSTFTFNAAAGIMTHTPVDLFSFTKSQGPVIISGYFKLQVDLASGYTTETMTGSSFSTLGITPDPGVTQIGTTVYGRVSRINATNPGKLTMYFPVMLVIPASSPNTTYTIRSASGTYNWFSWAASGSSIGTLPAGTSAFLSYSLSTMEIKV